MPTRTTTLVPFTTLSRALLGLRRLVCARLITSALLLLLLHRLLEELKLIPHLILSHLGEHALKVLRVALEISLHHLQNPASLHEGVVVYVPASQSLQRGVRAHVLGQQKLNYV